MLLTSLFSVVLLLFRYAKFALHPQETWHIRKLIQSGNLPDSALSYYARMKIHDAFDIPITETHPTINEGKGEILIILCEIIYHFYTKISILAL